MPLADLFARLRGSYTHVRLAILVTLLFTVLVATIFRTPSIIFMAALFFAAPLMGIVAGGFLSRGLTLARAVPEFGSVGDIVSGRLSISNRSMWPAFLIHLRPGGVNTSDDDMAAHEYSYGGNDFGEGETANGKARASDKSASRIGSSKVSAAKVVAAKAGKAPAPIALLGQDETIVPLLRAGERLEWAPQWRLQRRGVHQLPPARAGANDPLGLFSALNARTATNEITVLPRPLRVERLSFLGGSQANPRTPQHAAVVAEALDFHGVRAWRPGEAIRRVHWKSTARTGALHVVEWEESLGRDLTLLLDARSHQALASAATKAARNSDAEMFADGATKVKSPNKNGAARRGDDSCDEAFEAAVTLVASVAAHLLEGGHRFQLFCWQHAPDSPPEAGLATSNLFTSRPAARDDNAARKSSSQRVAKTSASASTPAVKASAPVMLRHVARGGGDVGDTLRMLARLEALPDNATTASATLSNLAAQAAPLLGRGDSVLMIVSTLSEVGAAIDALQLQGRDSSIAQAHVIALDAATFHAFPVADAQSARDAASPSVSAPSFAAHAMRIVRRGDSLVAALERE